MARTPGVALTIIGDGARRKELETLFAGTGTVFTGYLLNEDLAGAFASADLFVFTGPNETFGQVVQEAMASGLPSHRHRPGRRQGSRPGRRDRLHLPGRAGGLRRGSRPPAR